MARTKHSSPTLVLQITADDFDRAVQSSSGGCLIADAIKRQYPHLTGVTVDMATIRATDRKAGQRYTWLTSSPAQHLLLSYDQGWPQPIEELRIQRAVKITPVTRAKKGGRSPAAVASRREARKAELEAKLERGEDLTTGEKNALTRVSNPKPTPERPSTVGPVDAKVHPTGHVTVHGGKPLVQGPPHPNLLRGRDRHFGAKLADPGVAFKEAVEDAVAERLAQQEASEQVSAP